MTTKEKQEKAFHIGQIVYVLSNSGQAILPALIVEESTVETLEKKMVSWKLALGAGTKQRIVESTNIDGELFTDLSEIQKLLTVRLTKFVNKLLGEAKQRQKLWYGSPVEETKDPAPVQNKVAQKKLNPESLIEELDDSNVPAGKVKHVEHEPQIPAENLDGLPEEVKQAKIREQLRNMVQPDDDDEDDEPYPSVEHAKAATFTDVDGTKHKLNMI